MNLQWLFLNIHVGRQFQKASPQGFKTFTQIAKFLDGVEQVIKSKDVWIYFYALLKYPQAD